MKLRWCTINGSPASSGQSWGGLSFQATKLPSSSSDSTCITASLQADDMHRTSWPSESLYNVQTHMEALSHDTVISNSYRPHSSLTSIACIHFSCLTHAFFPTHFLCLFIFFLPIYLTLTFGFSLLSYSLSTPSVNHVFSPFAASPHMHRAAPLFPFWHLTEGQIYV